MFLPQCLFKSLIIGFSGVSSSVHNQYSSETCTAGYFGKSLARARRQSPSRGVRTRGGGDPGPGGGAVASADAERIGRFPLTRRKCCSDATQSGSVSDTKTLVVTAWTRPVLVHVRAQLPLSCRDHGRDPAPLALYGFNCLCHLSAFAI